MSDIVVFESLDGHTYDFAYVLARAGDHGVDCFEDPRVQLVCDRAGEHLVMTYTNLPCSPDEPWRVGAHLLDDDGERFHLDARSGSLLGPDGVTRTRWCSRLADGRIALVHRIHPDMQIAVFDDLHHLWNVERVLGRAPRDPGDHTICDRRPVLGIGAGAPPMASSDGLLLFFHERRADGVYTMNVALLDTHTGRRSPFSIRRCSSRNSNGNVGDVDDVVFVQGAHVQGDGDTKSEYGAANRHVGAAIASMRHLLELLRKAPGVTHATSSAAYRSR